MIQSDGEVLVLTTVANGDQAAMLARGIVDKRLAACVTCLPGALSFFRWQSSNISEEQEQVLLIKTHQDKLKELESYFEQEHPYEVPEFVIIDTAGVSSAYGQWMHKELKLESRGVA